MEVIIGSGVSVVDELVFGDGDGEELVEIDFPELWLPDEEAVESGMPEVWLPDE